MAITWLKYTKLYQTRFDGIFWFVHTCEEYDSKCLHSYQWMHIWAVEMLRLLLPYLQCSFSIKRHLKRNLVLNSNRIVKGLEQWVKFHLLRYMVSEIWKPNTLNVTIYATFLYHFNQKPEIMNSHIVDN